MPPPDGEEDAPLFVENHREKYRIFFEAVEDLGRWTSQALRQDYDVDMRAVSTLRAAWTTYFCTHVEEMREIRHEDKTRHTLGMHVVFELTRLHLLAHLHEIDEERDMLEQYDRAELTSDSYTTLFTLKDRTRDPMWLAICNSFVPDPATSEKEVDEEVVELHAKMLAIWSKPIMEYTQSETRMMALFLTQQLDEVPTAAPPAEYRAVYETLWLRMGELMLEDLPSSVLDEGEIIGGDGHTIISAAMRVDAPPLYRFNHAYAAFCSFYMGEIMRRFFYYDTVRSNPAYRMDLDLVPVRAIRDACWTWITRIINGFAEEAFEDLYARTTTTESYTFVGDDSWFKFVWPSRIGGRGACIQAFRPHLHSKYYSEAQVSKRAVLSSKNLSSRLFVIIAVDEYIRMQLPYVYWRNAAVVASDGMKDAIYVMEPSLAPLMIQVLSSYWVQDRGTYHVCDDIAEAVGVWMWLLREHHDSKLFGCDMTQIINEALGH